MGDHAGCDPVEIILALKHDIPMPLEEAVLVSEEGWKPDTGSFCELT